MMPVHEALQRACDLVSRLTPETVPIRAAHGRILAVPARAGLTQPPFDASSMDGYWLAAADYRPGARLPVVGEAAAGRGFSGGLVPGGAIRIFTGAPCPASGGVVIMQEHVTRDGTAIILPDDLPQADNIRPRGQDFLEGAEYAPTTPLTARDLGLLAAMNIAQVQVCRRPIVAVMATGDELVQQGEVPGPDQIICSNNVMIAALAEQAGAEVRILPIARDTEASLRFTLGLAEGADLIVTSGGASVGEHDLVGKVAADLGMERSFWKIAMRPGKPLMAGRIGGAVLLGLPGNPVSAAVCAKLFMEPMIRKMGGQEEPVCEPGHAELAVDLGPTGPRRHYMRARLEPGDPLPRIIPFDSQDSARLRLLAEADVLLIRPQDDGPIRAGEIVEYLTL